MLRDVHAERDRTAIDLLNSHVADPAVVAELDEQLDRAWRDVQPGRDGSAAFLAGLSTVLADAAGHNAGAARARVWSALVDDMTPTTSARQPASTARTCPGR